MKERSPKLDLDTLRAIPAGIWALGLVSLLMDISSEMIHGLLPVYLVTVLGASARAFAMPPATRFSPTSVRRICAARALGCGSRSIRWGPLSGRCWRSC
jgi:hypothetical protein